MTIISAVLADAGLLLMPVLYCGQPDQHVFFLRALIQSFASLRPLGFV